MEQNKTVKIFINGTKVEDQIIYWESNEIGVSITVPFKNLSTGLHIPLLARPVRSYAGGEGIETGKITPIETL